MSSTGATFEEGVASLKKAAAALREADVPFALAGGLAAWAQGSVEPRDDDIDLYVKPEDAERGLAALAAAGMRPSHPPEEWLVKAHDGRVLVDLIFGPTGTVVDDDFLAGCEVMQVQSVSMRVVPVQVVLATQLLAQTQHHIDFEGLLELTRAVREQIDWDWLRDHAKPSPFARAFIYLAEELGIAPH